MSPSTPGSSQIIMHPKDDENSIDAAATSPFHQLVPDCRQFIFSYHYHSFCDILLPSRRPKQHPQYHSNLMHLSFYLQYFKCHMISTFIMMLHERRNLKAYLDLGVDFPLLSNLYSWKLWGPRNNRVCSLPDYSKIFARFNNLVELQIHDVEGLRDGMFQHLGSSLEVLEICRSKGFLRLTDGMFTHLTHLRHLKLEHCDMFTDRAFENLYKAGSRLEKLELTGCPPITDAAFSFLRGISALTLHSVRIKALADASFHHLSGSIKKLEMHDCIGSEKLSRSMLYHLTGIERLVLIETGREIRIEAEDFPALKKILRNVSFMKVNTNIADDSTLKELQEFIEGNGGRFESEIWYDMVTEQERQWGWNGRWISDT